MKEQVLLVNNKCFEGYMSVFHRTCVIVCAAVKNCVCVCTRVPTRFHVSQVYKDVLKLGQHNQFHSDLIIEL